MGVDLRLLVVGGSNSNSTWGYSHTLLSLDRDYVIWEEIKESNTFCAPGFKLYSFVARCPDGSMKGEACYGEVVNTPYSEALMFQYAGVLVGCFEVCEYHLSKFNLAALAYLKALPPNTLVGLYWH